MKDVAVWAKPCTVVQNSKLPAAAREKDPTCCQRGSWFGGGGTGLAPCYTLNMGVAFNNPLKGRVNLKRIGSPIRTGYLPRN